MPERIAPKQGVRDTSPSPAPVSDARRAAPSWREGLRHSLRNLSYSAGTSALTPDPRGVASRTGSTGPDPRATASTAGPLPPPPTVRPSAASLGVRRTHREAQLRDTAGATGTLLATIPADEPIEAFADKPVVDGETWVYATWNGQSGYVSTTHVAHVTSLGKRKVQRDTAVHRGPGATSEQIAPLASGAELEILDLRRTAEDGQWIVALVPGRGWGYVKAGELAYPERMAGQMVPLRPSPDAGADTDRYIPKGATIGTCSAKVENADGVWIQVTYSLDAASGEGLKGWVLAKDLSADIGNTESRYREMYDQMQIRESGNVDRGVLAANAEYIQGKKDRYMKVARATGMPWYAIGVIHMRESDFDFDTYLHQGDPLGRPPVNWPTDIPTFYDWESAAIHAIGREREKFSKGLLEGLEGYNGTGYRDKGVNTPYLWSGTNHYDRGKYVADGRYSATARDGQPGAAGVLKIMEEKGYIKIDRGML